MKHFCEVALIGRLGRDPEIKTFNKVDGSSFSVASFSVAVNERWQDKSNPEQWQEKTTWHIVVVKNAYLVKKTQSKLRKGTTVIVRGAGLETREYQTKEGITKLITEVVLAGPRAELDSVHLAAVPRTEQAATPPVNGPTDNLGWDVVDDIPF